MTFTETNTKKHLEQFRRKSQYVELGKLISYSLSANHKDFNRHTFGYIPSNFREIEIATTDEKSKIQVEMSDRHISVGEPVIYKVCFPNSLTIGETPYFYVFCYLKENSKKLNVFFQSANRSSKFLSPQHYRLSSKKVNFEGLVSAFENDLSYISISDPGHFIHGLCSSFYVGTPELNFTQLISTVVERIASLSNIKHKDIFLFGSSAGGMGALLSSTYFASKVQVMSVNAQICVTHLSETMKVLLCTEDESQLLDKFGDRVSCIHRFQSQLYSVPNIFLSVNTNDRIFQRNFKFYHLYRRLFIGKGKNNQSVFDSYCGVNGHGRPDKKSLKIKIRIARDMLTLDSHPPQL